jgi:hypothetical protein
VKLKGAMWGFGGEGGGGVVSSEVGPAWGEGAKKRSV